MKRIIPVILLLASLAVQGQELVKEIDLSSEKAFLSGIVSNENNGTVVVGTRPANKNMIAIRLDTLLKEQWRIEVENEDYGYVDPSSDTKQLHVFIGEDNVYILHHRFSSSATGVKMQILKVDNNGDLFKGKYQADEDESLLRPYFQDNELKIMTSKRQRHGGREYFILTFDDDLSYAKKAEPVLGKVPGTPIPYNGGFKFQTLNAGYKGKNRIKGTYTFIDEHGKVRRWENGINFDVNVYPCPDINNAYGYGGSYTYYSTPYTRLYEENGMRLYYGMYSPDDDLDSKQGIYLVRYDDEWNKVYQKVHDFEKLADKFPHLEEIEGRKVYETHFHYDEHQNLFYYVFDNFQKKKESVSVVLNEDGDIVETFSGRPYYVKGDHRYALNCEGNTDYQEGTSVLFTTVDETAKNGLLKAAHKVKSAQDQKKKSYNVLYSNDSEYLVEYLLKKDILNFYKL